MYACDCCHVDPNVLHFRLSHNGDDASSGQLEHQPSPKTVKAPKQSDKTTNDKQVASCM